MYTIPPKKMVIINILDILKKYSDMDHRLTQAQIIEILKKEYYMDVDRRTVKRNLMNLLDFDFGIDYTEIIKKNEKGEEIPICTDWYITREFDDSEIRLLIDSVLFSKTIPQKQCKKLIDKLKGLSNIYFEKKVNHICSLPEIRPENKELFYTIDVLDEAISKGKKVSFIYNSYGTDKKLHPKREREYVINPYQMVATNGRYYLICNYDKYDTLSNYRIDRITGIKMMNEKRKSIKELKEGEINLPKHMAEHIYMFSGESVDIKLSAPDEMMNDLTDWFGHDFKILEHKNEKIVVRLTCNYSAMRYWALQYSPYVEILEPDSLREQLLKDAAAMAKKYGKKAQV